MALVTPGPAYLVGTATGSGVSTLTITPNVPTKAGDLIVVCTDSDEQPSPVSPVNCTDSAGNTYSLSEVSVNNVNPLTTIYQALNTSPLTTSSTITVTWTGSTDVNAAVLACPGIATSGALDQVIRRYTTNGTITISTGQLAQPNELAVAYWVSRQAQGEPSIAAGWASAAAFVGAPPNSPTHYVNLAWKVASTTTEAVTTTATTPSTGTGWAGVILTFRGQINPTATLNCGGSLAAFPVTPVSATATLHCGGSILGPAELAPVPPPPVPVFPAGYIPQTGDLEGWVRKSLRFCAGQIVFRAEQTSSQSLAANTFTPLQYGSVLEDPFGGWSTTSTASQAAWSWLAPWTGWYRVTFRYLTSSTSAWHDPALGVSGVNPAYEPGGLLSPSSASGGSGLSAVIPLIGGQDYVQLLANPSAACTTDVSAIGRRASVEITSVQTDLQGGF